MNVFTGAFMIQKIRSYLLDNKENKESIGWYVAIIMLVPLFSYFFISKGIKNKGIGSVNGEQINVNVFRVKLYQQSLLLETIYKSLGKKEADYLVSLFFQGRSPEEFLLIESLKQTFLNGIFKKYMAPFNIATQKIALDLSRNEPGFKQFIGEVFYEIISKENPSQVGIERSISMEEVDAYVEQSYQNNFSSMILQSLLSGTEKKIFSQYFLQKNIKFLTYTLDKKKAFDHYKNLVDLKKVQETELKFMYENGLKEGKFQKNKTYTFSFVKYGLKEGEKKDLLKINSKEEKKKELEKKLSTLLSKTEEENEKEYEKILEEHFVRLSGGTHVSLEVSGEDKKSSIPLPTEILNFVTERNTKFNALVADDTVYFISKINNEKVTYYSFEEAQKEILELYLKDQVTHFITEKITLLRYELEEKGRLFDHDIWVEGELDFDVLKQGSKGGKADSLFSSLMRKVSVGGMKEKSTCWVDTGEKITLFYVVSFEKEASLPQFYAKRENIFSFGVFFENLLRQAKIDINDQSQKDLNFVAEADA